MHLPLTSIQRRRRHANSYGNEPLVGAGTGSEGGTEEQTMIKSPNPSVQPGSRGRRRAATLPAIFLLLIAAWGCDSILDVENPNSLTSEDAESVASAPALANGVLSSLSSAAGTVLRSHGTVADEFTRIGTHDFYDPLNEGNLRDPANTLVDGPFGSAAEARWLGDFAIETLRGHVEAGQTSASRPLARSYLYTGLAYVLVADHFEDFAFSNRTVAAPPLGKENMGQVYDQAIAYFGEGLALAEGLGDQNLVLAFLASRARTRHARAIRQSLLTGTAAANPLVDDAQALQDITRFFQLAGPESDWRLTYTYSPSTVTNTLASTVNQRGEIMWQTDYVLDPYSDRVEDRWTPVLRDPVDDIVDPVLSARIQEFRDGDAYTAVTAVSAEELHLIRAEAALARGDEAGFAEAVNRVRDRYAGLSPFAGQVDALELLRHQRRVTLLVMGRRLHDHYRFGEPSSNWRLDSEAVREPGTLFPMGARELRANCHVLGTC